MLCPISFSVELEVTFSYPTFSTYLTCVYVFYVVTWFSWKPSPLLQASKGLISCQLLTCFHSTSNEATASGVGGALSLCVNLENKI